MILLMCNNMGAAGIGLRCITDEPSAAESEVAQRKIYPHRPTHNNIISACYTARRHDIGWMTKHPVALSVNVV